MIKEKYPPPLNHITHLGDFLHTATIEFTHEVGIALDPLNIKDSTTQASRYACVSQTLTKSMIFLIDSGSIVLYGRQRF